MDKQKSLWIRILVPALIIAVIAALWIVKANADKPETILISETMSSSDTTPNDLPEHLLDADFTLNETSEIDFKALSAYGLPVIVDYGADSCIPCKQMAPVLVKLNKEMYGKAFIKFVDVWKYSEAAMNAPIQVIPTQVFFNADGTPFVPSEELSGKIDFMVYTHRDTDEHIFTVHQGGLTEDQLRAILTEMGVE